MSGEVPRGKKMLYSGTDPESHITKYTSIRINNARLVKLAGTKNVSAGTFSAHRPRGDRCRANMAHVRQSRPNDGLDFQVKVHKTVYTVPSSHFEPSLDALSLRSDVTSSTKILSSHLQEGLEEGLDLPRMKPPLPDPRQPSTVPSSHTLHATRYTLRPTPHTLHPAPFSPRGASRRRPPSRQHEPPPS